MMKLTNWDQVSGLVQRYRNIEAAINDVRSRDEDMVGLRILRFSVTLDAIDVCQSRLAAMLEGQLMDLREMLADFGVEA
jgi:hypothetical protein